MSNMRNLVASTVVALFVGGGAMAYDKWKGAEWVVSPEQIAEAKAGGNAGYQSAPGTVAVRPIRSEIADVLPFKWLLYGVAAGALTFVSLRKKKAA
ncbi:hypothetical protein [Shinella sp.]|uniref:hypothetical protein n=1 Tax=Shinella sp. TaxID=1870904 RepID=UPI00301C39F8